jgi:hypothetical protein
LRPVFSAQLAVSATRFASLDKASAKGWAILTQKGRYRVQDVMGNLPKANPGRGRRFAGQQGQAAN